MGMDNRQIARVMRIEYKSVITARYRLRTRLKLNKEDSLESLLHRLSETQPKELLNPAHPESHSPESHKKIAGIAASDFP